MLEVKVVTLKPLENLIEYGLRDSETLEWSVHGIVLPFTLSASTTGQEVIEAATADAVTKGLLEP